MVKFCTKSYKFSPLNLTHCQARFTMVNQSTPTLIHRTVCYKIFVAGI